MSAPVITKSGSVSPSPRFLVGSSPYREQPMAAPFNLSPCRGRHPLRAGREKNGT